MYLPIHAKSCLRFVEINHLPEYQTTLRLDEAERFLQELQEAIDDAKHKAKLLDSLAQKPKK